MNYFVRVFDPKGKEIYKWEVDRRLVKLNSKTEEEAAWFTLLEVPDAATVLREIRRERE